MSEAEKCSECVSGSSRNQMKEDELVDLFREATQYLNPSKAALIEEKHGSYRLRVDFSTRNTYTMEPSTLTKFFQLKVDGDQIKEITTTVNGIDTSTDSTTVYSSSGKKWATIRKGNSSGPPDGSQQKVNQVVHFWQGDKLIRSLTPEDLEKHHGSIVTEKTFGNIAWSPDEKLLMYVAESKPPKTQSYFKESKESQSDVSRGQECAYRETWGESFDGVTHTCVCIVDLENKAAIHTLDIPGFSLGSPFWMSNDTIGFVGWSEEPRRIGIIYCNNRPNRLYTYNIVNRAAPQVIRGDKAAECIQSPRLAPNGRDVLLLTNEIFGPHRRPSRLVRLETSTGSQTVLIDIPPNSKEGALTLYVPDSLPDNCFSKDGRFALLENIEKCRVVLYLVDINTGHATKLENSFNSVSVLTMLDDLVIVQSSSPNALPSLHIGRLDSKGKRLNFQRIDHQPDESVSDLSFAIEEIPIKGSPGTPLHTIIVGQSSQMDKSRPTVVIPHGGPHASFVAGFILLAKLNAKLGWKTLLINYRGSIGMDENYASMLCGNIGEMDVADCLTCIDYHVEKGGVDRNNLILYSGSHGGYLITLLCGKYPEYRYKACIARNPVIDISSMVGITDIPDWCWTEVQGVDKPYSPDWLRTSEFAKLAFEKSPLKYVSGVKTPTLMLLGKNDKRVPMSQGLEYYKILKARGVDCRCYVYDDKHDLMKPTVEADAFVNYVLWTIKYVD